MPRMRRGVVAVLVVAAAARAAEASPIRLDVTGDACSLDGLEARLTALAGTDPVDASAAAAVRIEVTAPGAARIFFDDGVGAIRGPRIVDATSCVELAESVALVIAMALPDRPAPVAAPVAAESKPAPVETAIVVAHEPARSTPITFDVLAAGGGGVSAHGLAGQLIAGARVRSGALSVDAELRADAPQQVVLAQMAGIEVTRAQVSLGPCVHAGGFAGCAVASVGAFHGSGSGLVSARSAYSTLVAGGARVTWEHAITDRLALRLHAGVDALATTTVFDVDHMQVWVSPRIEGSAGIGVLAHFP